jgi:UDP-N-acetylglucosamine 2-epimerase (non-hydrolysing)
MNQLVRKDADNELKIIMVAGARPNFMKVKPFLRTIEIHNSRGATEGPKITTLLVHTGQHYDQNMSDIFFRELGIRRPDINLAAGSGSHAVQTANIMLGFEPICIREKPDWVVVVGDVNSTMACTLVCAKLSIPIAHIEAGLRSFDRTMPEEINRVVTDALADLLLTPSRDADENLMREGIPEERIRLVGNIMIDSVMENLRRAQESDILNRLKIDSGHYMYVTLHRPSNVDDQAALASIMTALGQLSLRVPVIFPMHPRTRRMLSEFGVSSKANDQVKLLDPIGYHSSLWLTKNARLVLTDSGGLQEEATFFRTPCLTLRPNTERPITLILGSNRLTKLESLVRDVDDVLRGPEKIGQVPPFWDGHTAERILKCLLEATGDLRQ